MLKVISLLLEVVNVSDAVVEEIDDDDDEDSTGLVDVHETAIISQQVPVTCKNNSIISLRKDIILILIIIETNLNSKQICTHKYSNNRT